MDSSKDEELILGLSLKILAHFLTCEIYFFFANLASIMSTTSVKCSCSTFEDSLSTFISAYRIWRYTNSGSQG